jgi:hypothetical protein
MAGARIYSTTVAPSRGSRRHHHWLQITRARFSPGEGQNYSHRVWSLHYRRLQGGNRHRRASPSITRTESCMAFAKASQPVDHSPSTRNQETKPRRHAPTVQDHDSSHEAVGDESDADIGTGPKEAAAGQ